MQNRKSWEDPSGKIHAGPVLHVVEDFTVIDCECCKFKHVVPLPTQEELTSVYSHEYYTQEKPLYIDHYLEDKEWWDAVYAERYRTLDTYLKAENRSILDIGSGPGLFLALGRERGWNVKGIEPSIRASEYSRKELGLDIECIFLDRDTAKDLGSFDAINMGEVLEHLVAPADMIEIAYDLLKPGGILLVVVPNDFNPFQIVLRDYADMEPWWVAPPHHINYFNHDSLARVVEQKGFEVLRLESTFPIDMFLLMGQNYVGDDKLGRQVHGLRKAFDENLFKSEKGSLRKSLMESFASLGIGREVVLYARKQTRVSTAP